jgi:hypothetical protein
MADARNSRDERALGALFVLLALLAAWQLARDETPDLPASLAVPLQRPAARAAGDPAAEVAEILERPLFSSDRGRERQAVTRPASVAVVEPEAAPTTALEGWTLVGLTSQGDRVVALLREGANGATRLVRSGDMLGGWTVLGQGGRRVLLLQRDGELTELSIMGHAPPSLPTSEPK